MYTAHDGTVSLCHPAPEMFLIMQFGGYWRDRPNGFVEVQIERQIKDGIHPDHARRYANAIAFGGCTESEVWDIIKDRDCARYGKHHDLVSLEDLPDAWFRDAWVRGHNGGPAFVDLAKARNIQWQKISSAVAEENKARQKDLFGKRQIKLIKSQYRSFIMRARDEDELKKIWPEELAGV